MGQKLVVGPFNRGLRNDRTAFNIDNDSFPTLINAYQWRGRIKRKRGTQFLCRLQRFLGTTDAGGNLTVTILPAPIDPGVISIFVGSNLFTDGDTSATVTVTLITNGPGTATLNRTTGVLTITGSIPLTSVIYNPSLPVMGLEDLILLINQFPGTLGFDTKYSYNINTPFPYTAYDVSFYKNPPSGLYPGYTQKTASAPVWWNGEDYQQFWTVNYLGALWATNGITIPFTTTNIGMQFSPVTAVAAPVGQTVVITVTGPNLIVGDFVFLNEFDPTIITGVNFQTGYVTAGSAPGAITITLPNATLAGTGGATTKGIVQYLTNRSDTTKDNIRWYDGDPTNGVASAPTLLPGKGWVNFMPPLSQFAYSINDTPLAQYYLVGARMIVPFKDRLLFFGPVIQTSANNAKPLYLQDTIIYSQNGTPYYTASFSGDVFNPTTPPGFVPILVPDNQTATPFAWWEDQTGFGGFTSAGIDRAITTVSTNEDALIVGFDANIQTRVIYSGDDILPFNFFIINGELGSSSTFSAVNMDYGVITRGNRGFVVTSQTQAQRIDLEIPDQVFETKLTNNGTERVCSQRDFINEWIYFTYPGDIESNVLNNNFPSQTLQYNYRDNSWAIFLESYTTYGSFRKQTGFTWATVGSIFESWEEWNEPWDAGSSELEQPLVIAGNQEGFVLIRDAGTGEATSLSIQNIVGSTVTCINHCLNEGDYIIITQAQGTVSSFVNNRIFSIHIDDLNSFDLNPLISTPGLTYTGGGLITRIYIPRIQTKQFPAAWDMGRKTRLGPQQYLFTTTDLAQVTLQIFLSQNASNPYNFGKIVPDPLSVNNSLIYSQILYTCPESTNLGLTPANINLQTPTAIEQEQIWHRVNTSLIGDTVQLGFTLSDDQVRDFAISNIPIIITEITQANPAVITATGPFAVENGELLEINGVVGMTQLNGNIYTVISSTSTQITINVDSTGFGAYISGGTASQAFFNNIFDEIELHGFILDLNPSQLLV